MNIDFYRFTDFYRLTTPGKFAYKTTKFYAINEQEEILLLSYHALTADLDRRPRIAGAWINYHQNERCAKTAKWWCHDYCFCSLLASLGSDLSRAEKNVALICATCKKTHRIKASWVDYRWTWSLTMIWRYLFIYFCFSASLAREEKKTEEKKKKKTKEEGMIAGYVWS